MSAALGVQRVNGTVWLRRAAQSSHLARGVALRVADQIEVEAGAAATLVTADGATIELGPQTRFLVSRVDSSRSELRLEAGILRIDAGDVPHRGLLTLELSDLRFNLGPGRFFFEHLMGPANVGRACAFAGTASLDASGGAAGQLRDGQCVALDRLGTTGPILLRSIARVVEREPQAQPASPRAAAPVAPTTPVTPIKPVTPPKMPGSPAGVAVGWLEPQSSVATALGTVTAMAAPATVPPAASGSQDAGASDRATDPGVSAIPNEQDIPHWIVNIASFSNRSEGEGLVTHLREDGLEVVLRDEQVQGRPSYRAVITGLRSESDAKLMVDRLARDYGYRMAWPLRSR